MVWGAIFGGIDPGLHWSTSVSLSNERTSRINIPYCMSFYSRCVGVYVCVCVHACVLVVVHYGLSAQLDSIPQEQILRATQYLPGIVRLQQRLFDLFNHKLDRKEAESLTIRTFLQSKTGKDKSVIVYVSSCTPTFTPTFTFACIDC